MLRLVPLPGEDALQVRVLINTQALRQSWPFTWQATILTCFSPSDLPELGPSRDLLGFSLAAMFPCHQSATTQIFKG